MPVDRSYYRISPDATEPEFRAVAKQYARAVVDEYDLTVNVSALEWEISHRAKRRAGAVKHQSGEPRAISLTWDYFEAYGWAGIADTIRHELIHAHLLNEQGDGSHGDAFTELAAELDAPVHCERFATPRWWVVCEDCGNEFARYRRSKVVKHPEKYRCGDCGGTLHSTEASEMESTT